jgi:hypothetical protein
MQSGTLMTRPYIPLLKESKSDEGFSSHLQPHMRGITDTAR